MHHPSTQMHHPRPQKCTRLTGATQDCVVASSALHGISPSTPNLIEASMEQVGMSLPPWAVRAGARKQIYFDPQQVTAAIVTCGGLCPGLNDVVAGIVNKLTTYGVQEGNILGIRYGFRCGCSLGPRRVGTPSLGRGAPAPHAWAEAHRQVLPGPRRTGTTEWHRVFMCLLGWMACLVGPQVCAQSGWEGPEGMGQQGAEGQPPPGGSKGPKGSLSACKHAPPEGGHSCRL
eukprot:351270-Chlamydomonas_euryale.AAC.13